MLSMKKEGRIIMLYNESFIPTPGKNWISLKRKEKKGYLIFFSMLGVFSKEPNDPWKSIKKLK